MSNYYYKRTEPNLWTVGIGEGGDWQPESDHFSPAEAAKRVHYLNGGNDPALEKRNAEDDLNYFAVKIILLREVIKDIVNFYDANDKTQLFCAIETARDILKG